jgi:hypothetical protein
MGRSAKGQKNVTGGVSTNINATTQPISTVLSTVVHSQENLNSFVLCSNRTASDRQICHALNPPHREDTSGGGSDISGLFALLD